MQALLLTEYRKLELTSLDRPTVGPDDVLVSVRACGICGSDVHGYDGSTGRRIPPLVMGHESAGVVAEVGANVTHVRPGDHVALDSLLSCGVCELCRHGKTNMCAGRRILGVACNEFRQQGAFAEFVVVPQQAIYPVPNELPFEHAALVEPVSVALHAVGRLRIDLGDSAAVVGSGMIGLLVIQALNIAGCDEVIAIDLDEDRLRLAAELGATATVNTAKCDAVAAVWNAPVAVASTWRWKSSGPQSRWPRRSAACVAAGRLGWWAMSPPRCRCRCKSWSCVSFRSSALVLRRASIRGRSS